jgi:hypothetical protein
MKGETITTLRGSDLTTLYTSGTLSATICLRFSPTSEEASSSRDAGVSIEPGLTALTRMRRSFKSVVHVRANERTAALVAE